MKKLTIAIAALVISSAIDACAMDYKTTYDSNGCSIIASNHSCFCSAIDLSDPPSYITSQYGNQFEERGSQNVFAPVTSNENCLSFGETCCKHMLPIIRERSDCFAMISYCINYHINFLRQLPLSDIEQNVLQNIGRPFDEALENIDLQNWIIDMFQSGNPHHIDDVFDFCGNLQWSQDQIEGESQPESGDVFLSLFDLTDVQDKELYTTNFKTMYIDKPHLLISMSYFLANCPTCAKKVLSYGEQSVMRLQEAIHVVVQLTENADQYAPSEYDMHFYNFINSYDINHVMKLLDCNISEDIRNAILQNSINGYSLHNNYFPHNVIYFISAGHEIHNKFLMDMVMSLSSEKQNCIRNFLLAEHTEGSARAYEIFDEMRQCIEENSH